jgi:hypothetical protein
VRRRRNDPYMRDPNIRAAANMQLIAWPFLGIGIGWAASGWFQFPTLVGIATGAVIGFVIATLILGQFGGRSTR